MTASLASLPSVSQLLNCKAIQQLESEFCADMVRHWIRAALSKRRQQLLDEFNAASSREQELERLTAAVVVQADHYRAAKIRKIINATGVVLHTNLGRAALGNAAIDAIVASARGTNVELDLTDGHRRYRGFQIVDQLRVLTGCEDALLVNNNAAATLLALQVISSMDLPQHALLHHPPVVDPDHSANPGRQRNQIIISRGQLIEIGGSFRLPEIFELSGAVMREVGTTNRTHLTDYAQAIGPQTAAIIRVHPSNFRVTGFADTPGIQDLVKLGQSYGVPVIDDIGSGCLTDMSVYGLPAEPTFGESIQTGADVVLGSGDKLLGGPQCGIIIGKTRWISRMRNHPLARALRVDKLTIAALSATLDAYLTRNVDSLAVHQLLVASKERLRERAESLVTQLNPVGSWKIDIADDVAEVGGGSLPGTTLPTVVIRLRSTVRSTEGVALQLRTATPSIVPRIRDDRVLIDLRSVLPEELPVLLEALNNVCSVNAITG